MKQQRKQVTRSQRREQKTKLKRKQNRVAKQQSPRGPRTVWDL